MYEYAGPDLQTQALTAAYTERLSTFSNPNVLEPVPDMERLTSREAEIDVHHGIPLTEQERLGFESREGDAQVRVIGMIGIPGARFSRVGESDLGIGYAALLSEAHGSTTRLALQGLTVGADGRAHKVETVNGAERVYLPPSGSVIIGRNAVSDKGPVITATKLWGKSTGGWDRSFGNSTSRENTEIRTTADGGVLVKDLDSKGGTFVSREAIVRRPERAAQPQAIRYAGAMSLQHQ